ncbi:MAG: NAD-dependent epimerase/dehydratase family protein [Nitrososphaerota archaeon]
MALVLITGSQGFIGRSLREYLEKRGYSIIGLDISDGAEIKANILSLDDILMSLREYRPGNIVHLAAVSNPTSCRVDPHNCLNTNVIGTVNMLEAARRLGVERFIYLSSANVYGSHPPLPVSEESPLAPRTVYDYSKVIAEKCVESYNRVYGVPTVVFRSWKVFGEYDSPQSAVSRFIDACLKGGEIILYNGGRDVTDPYHVDNLGRAVELALSREEAVGEVFNIGTGNAVSIRELAGLIKKLTASSVTIREAPPRSAEEAEPMISYPSIEKIKRLLGYTPIVGLEEGLRRQIMRRRLALGL